MKTGLVIIVLMCFSWASSALAQEDPWVFLPGTPLFEPLIGDPLEPHTGLEIYTTQNRPPLEPLVEVPQAPPSPYSEPVTDNNQNRFEGMVGGTMEIARCQPPGKAHWGMGFFGAGFILLDQNGASFPMRAGDWYAGLYASESLGWFENRLQLEHQSSHLGDSLQSEQKVIIFNGENINFTTAIRPGEWLRLYAGAGYWINFYPASNNWFASLGAELYTPTFGLAGVLLRGYSTVNLNWETLAEGIFNKTFQLGLQWKFEKQQTRAIRIALVYYNGNSKFGQFYREPDEHLGFGFYFDP